jgi:TonB family protein
MLDWYGNNLELKHSYLKYILISIVIHILIFLAYGLYLKNYKIFNHGSYSNQDSIAVNVVNRNMFNSSQKMEINQANKASSLPKSHKYILKDSNNYNENNVNQNDKVSSENINNSNTTQYENSKIDYYHKSISYEELLALSGKGGNVNQTPNYPLIAKINKWQGEVIIIVKLDEKGYVEEAFVKKSSGHEVLDNSALKSIKNWHIDNKYAQKLTIEIPVIFKLIK